MSESTKDCLVNQRTIDIEPIELTSHDLAYNLLTGDINQNKVILVRSLIETMLIERNLLLAVMGGTIDKADAIFLMPELMVNQN